MQGGLSIALLMLAGSLACDANPSPEDLDFLHGLTEYANIRRMLPEYLRREGQSLLDARKRSLDLSSPAAVARRGTMVREQILAAIGGLPERTPLNARTVGVIHRNGYHIEKVIFESQPRFFVSASLYVPEAGSPPYPAVLFPLGHEPGGKACAVWQQMLGTLASRGYIALAWDPIGQGERISLPVGSSTTEHTLMGVQCLLTGQALARYTIWDGMRALDYLLSRSEADPKRVACTGNSGGGTHTAYLAALDSRIQAAAPSCYMTSWHWLLNSIGPQDAEQVFPGWLADGLDFPDFIYAFGPKPFLMLSAIRDFFPIDGARETFSEAKRAETALSMFESDDEHGYTEPRRMAAYRWLGHWLKGADDTAPEKPIAPLPAETLNCTASGHVEGETVFSLNRALAERLREQRIFSPGRVRAAALARSAYREPSGAVALTGYGTIERSAYRIQKLIYESEPGILIPALLYLPSAGGRRPAVLIADEGGKSAADALADSLARRGSAVLAIDMRGMGETRPPTGAYGPEFDHYFGDYDDGMSAILIHRPLVGMRALDIVRGVDLLTARPEVDGARISGVGRGAAAIPLLYAAVFDQRLKSIAVERMPPSYDAIVATPIEPQVFESVVPGALIDFDLPDLMRAIAPRMVRVETQPLQ